MYVIFTRSSTAGKIPPVCKLFINHLPRIGELVILPAEALARSVLAVTHDLRADADETERVIVELGPSLKLV